MKSTTGYLAVFLLFVSIIAKAEIQEAHIHGVATLTLVLESEFLEIQFESPIANLIGFEHKAEKQAVKKAETILKSATRLFLFVGTSCKPEETVVNISGVMEGENDHLENHYHSKDHGDSSHSEIKLHYRFICSDPQNLDSLSITLFNLFPRIEKINAMWVTDVQQGSELLSPSRNTLSLR